MTTEPLTRTDKIAVVAELLDLDVDHDIDLAALIDDAEADGLAITTDPTDAEIDDLSLRATTYTTIAVR